MKKYNPKAKCPKCGYGGISTEYGRHGMERHCCQCSYSWIELPLDGEYNEKNIHYD